MSEYKKGDIVYLDDFVYAIQYIVEDVNEFKNGKILIKVKKIDDRFDLDKNFNGGWFNANKVKIHIPLVDSLMETIVVPLNYQKLDSPIYESTRTGDVPMVNPCKTICSDTEDIKAIKEANSFNWRTTINGRI